MTNSNEKVKKLNALDVMADEVTPDTENEYDGVPLGMSISFDSSSRPRPGSSGNSRIATPRAGPRFTFL